MQHLVLIDGDNQRTSRRPTPPRARRFTPASNTRRSENDSRSFIEGSESFDNNIRIDRPRILELHREPAVHSFVNNTTSSAAPSRNDYSLTALSEMPRYIRNALKLHTWIVQQQWIMRVAKTCW